jgi:hypothetical protein
MYETYANYPFCSNLMSLICAKFNDFIFVNVCWIMDWTGMLRKRINNISSNEHIFGHKWK